MVIARDGRRILGQNGDKKMKKKLGTIAYKRNGTRIKKTLWAVILDDGKILLYFKEYNTAFVQMEKVMFESAGFRCKYKMVRQKWDLSSVQTSYTIWARFQKREKCEEFIEELNAGKDFQVIYSIGFSMDELFATGILEMLGD